MISRLRILNNGVGQRTLSVPLEAPIRHASDGDVGHFGIGAVQVDTFDTLAGGQVVDRRGAILLVDRATSAVGDGNLGEVHRATIDIHTVGHVRKLTVSYFDLGVPKRLQRRAHVRECAVC